MKKKILVILAISMLLIISGCSKEVDSKDVNNNEQDIVKENNDESNSLNFDSNYLVSQKWLNENLENKDLLILDARGQKAYNKYHIPGAIVTSWQSLSNMEGAPGDKGWGVVKNAEKLSENISALGIDKSKKVVVYTDVLNGWGEDARILWTLEMAGLENVRILDGGINLWKSSDLKVSKEVSKAKKSDFKVKDLDKSNSINFEKIKENYDEYVIVDTRQNEEYEGATNYGEKRGGHLPNAIHFNFRKVLNEKGTFKHNETVEKIFKEGRKFGVGALVISQRHQKFQKQF